MLRAAFIDAAIKEVSEKGTQAAFLQRLLIDTLQWPIDPAAKTVEETAFEWSAEELKAGDLSKKLVDNCVWQIRTNPAAPWGIFLLEFTNLDAFHTNRGMTGPLRTILRTLVPKARALAAPTNRPVWKREHLLFICTHKYQHFRFAYFKAPEGQTKTAPLAAFGWSPDIPARTACEHNLLNLQWPEKFSPEIFHEKWADAFNVEKVTKKFYEDYRKVFEATEAAIGDKNPIKGEDLRLFTQALFNRLMFLRFIERKGWLIFPAPSPLPKPAVRDGVGITAPPSPTNRAYLANLFQAGPIGKSSFYNSRLKSLFFEGLAKEHDRQKPSPIYGDVPFLNGGLFESDERDQIVKDISDHVFAKILHAESGLFYRYNFTVEESTPLDIEVAVDPEMLGKVFEELVTGRHESGSYYTPRPVVSFMCREALKGFLASATKAPEAAIAALVDKHEVEGLNQSHANEIISALDKLKAVDPACGSGAYLLGLLHELLAIYRALENPRIVLDPDFFYKTKLRVISDNLYGVDIDPFATSVAMLRLWLSLAVDSAKPLPLPNLDFKVETGDSLLAPNPQDLPDLFRVQIRNQADLLVILKQKHFDSHADVKSSLFSSIKREEAALAATLKSRYGADIVDWRIQFAEVFAGENVGFDIVLANPPYVNMVQMDIADPEYRNRIRSEFITTTGGFDLFIPFMERGVQLLNSGGQFVYIVPNKVLSAEYATALRKHFSHHMRLLSLTDLSRVPIFSASVYPFIVVASKTPPITGETWVNIYGTGARSLDEVSITLKSRSPMSLTAGTRGSWSPLVGGAEMGKMTSAIKMCPTLETLADVSGAATVSEAYEWKEAVRDDGSKYRRESPDRYAKFVVSGNIRRFFHTWHCDKVQYIKKGYWQPVLDKESAAVSAKRARQIETEKIIVSGMSKRPTCVWDCEGVAAGKSTVIVIPKRGVDGNYLAAILNSQTMAEIYKMLFGSLSLSGGYLRFGPPQIKSLPIVNAGIEEQAALSALAQKCLDAQGVNCQAWEKEIDERVAALYGMDLADLE